MSDTPGDQEKNRSDLLDEAKDLVGSVRRQFLLLLGTGAFMLVTLSVSDETLISGQESVTVPVLDIPTSLSSLILAGPLLLAGLLCYMHLLLGRLAWLSANGIHPPQTDFFTIRETVPKTIADVCFYLVAPLSCGWFFLRTIFRPEAGLLLGIFCLTLLVCSVAFFRRSRRNGHWLRHRVAQAYLGTAVVLILGAGLTFTIAGRAPFQKAASLLTELDLSGADLSGLGANVSFRGFNFDGQCLRQANLSGLDLSGASFVGADLSGTDLSGANLNGAVLDGAKLDGAVLAKTQLSEASLRFVAANRVKAAAAVLDHSDLTGALLTRADLSRASMLRIVAVDLTLRRANMKGARLTGATLDCADFREVEGPRMLFQSVASARFARFSDATLTRSNFNAGNFDQSDFTRAELTGSSFGASSLGGTVFDRAITNGVDFDAAAVFRPLEKAPATALCPITPTRPAIEWANVCR